MTRGKNYLSSVMIAACCLLVASALAAEQTLTISLKDRPDQQKGSVVYMSGYLRTVSGQTLEYSSSHPDACSALLVRAQKDQSAVWETDTLTTLGKDGLYHLIWLTGLERGGLDKLQPHTFMLLINGKPYFRFVNHKDDTAGNWTVPGPDKSQLRFESQMSDVYGDLFGLMFLDLPPSAVERGKPLRLEVLGEDAASADWYMTFQYRLNSRPNVRLLPVRLKSDSANRLLRVSADNLLSAAELEISAPGQTALRKTLQRGANSVDVPVSDSRGTALRILYRHNGVETGHEALSLPPLTPRDIYLLPYAHTDIGYTDLQLVVERKHWKNIDDALRFIQKTKDYPADARFKWNIEVLWPLESYLLQASDAQKQALTQAVKDGTIGLNAFYANVLTGLMSAAELRHSLDYSHTLATLYQHPINTAVISDIPGFTWGTVNALAQSGVCYFASATNPFDRIGHMLEVWGDKPFWWRSQSGTDSVLMWMPAVSYALFHKGSLPQVGGDKLFMLLHQLDERHYPYRIVQLPYTLGDNAGVDTLLPDFVKNWNEKYSSPHLIIATHQQMFEAFEKDYGKQLPSFAGDLTPYWEDGAMSTASEVIMNRHSADRLTQAKRRYPSCPDSIFSSAWRDVILFDEHTWGAANSIDQPDDSGVVAQWKHKQQFAVEGFRQSRNLNIPGLRDPLVTNGHPKSAAQVNGNVLSNEFLTVEVDTATGAIRHLFSKTLHHDFADSVNWLNHLLYLPGSNPDSAQHFVYKKIGQTARKGYVVRCRLVGESPVGDEDRCEIRLISSVNRVDITHRITKRPIRTKESLHIAFPFNVPDGQIRYDVANAIVRPELDQLPGSNKNFFSVNSWIDVSNHDYGITLATPDIPLAEFGEITAEQPWREHVAPGTAVYSYVLNNYWHTNFKADQEGIVEFRYSLQPHGPFDSTTAAAFGQQQREPLITFPATAAEAVH
ncbi:MAG TPA: hypothetical protein VGL38_14450 [bacterium]